MYRHYLNMGLAFTLLFTLAFIGLEITEGYKITTSEYLGFRGEAFVIFLIIMFRFVHGLIMYPITFLPLTFLLNKYVQYTIIRVLIFTLVGSIGGVWAFNHSFGSDGRFVDLYQLNMHSSIIFFGISGLMYAIVNDVLRNRNKPFIKDMLKSQN